MLARALALTTLFILVPNARADDAKDAEGKLKEYLGTIKGTEAARITPLAADGVKETFPDHVLFSVLFPQFPVARIAPAPSPSALPAGRPAGLNGLVEKKAAQIILEVFRAGVAATGLLRDRFEDDGFQVARYAGVQPAGGLRIAVRDGVHEADAVDLRECRLQGQQLVQGEAQAIDIAAGIGSPAEALGSNVS